MAKRKRKWIGMIQYDWYGDQFLEIIDQRGEEGLIAAAEYVLEEAIRRAPKRTGLLVRTAYWATKNKTTWQKVMFGQKKAKKVPNENTIVFGFAAKHSHLVERRTKARVIAPRASRGKKALWVWGYGVVRARAERPALKGRKFFGPAIDASQTEMVEHLAQTLRVHIEREMPR